MKKSFTITEWVESKESENEDYWYYHSARKFPISLMTKIDDKIWEVDMFSKEGWKTVSRELKGINPYSSQEDLGDGFSEFCEIWADDNDLDVDWCNPSDIRRGKKGNYYIYFDQLGDRYVYVYGHKNLYDILLDRFVDFVQSD